MTDPTTSNTYPRLSVSTWSLHRSLGDPKFYGPDAPAIPLDTHNRGAITLLDLPARVAEIGIRTLEICHFHLPSREPAYLAQLRKAIEDAGIELWSLLVDAGDVTHSSHAERDEAWIAGWMDTAAQLGAKRARMIAGKAAPSDATLAQSRDALLRLADYVEARGLRLMTENWFELLPNAQVLLKLFDQLDGRVGLCFDFGNWKGEHKYRDLQAIAHLAESCHAKPQFTAPLQIDRDDYVRCFSIIHKAGFNGPYTLIYDGPSDDEFAGLAMEKDFAQPYL